MIFVTQKVCARLFKLLILTTLLLGVSTSQTSAAEIESNVIIYQIQTGATGSVSQEYVSIFNNSDSPVDVTNWCINYATASDATQTQLTCLTPPNTKTKLILHPYKTVSFATTEFLQAYPEYRSDAIFKAGIATASGHIKLLNSSKAVVDSVGWGAATNPETTAITAHINGKILQRKQADDHKLQDTNNNAQDFVQADILPASSGNISEEQIQYTCPIEYPLCLENHPIISEIYPNPEGADTGREFIELHNPSSHAVQLEFYVLQLGSKSFQLPATVLEPGAYISFTDAQSGLILPNTSASIKLISPMGDVIREIAYDNLAENVSWALINNVWHATFQPTPGAENIEAPHKPCTDSKTYNASTGKCQATAAVTAPTPCKVNQIRNVDTGRCRNIVAPAAATICKPGQEKNSTTNRCKNIAVTQITKPCPEGQQRNAETNRCRKIVASIGANGNVKDVKSPLITNSAKWWIAGVGALGAGGYALFEWRREALNFLPYFRSKTSITA